MGTTTPEPLENVSTRGEKKFPRMMRAWTRARALVNESRSLRRASEGTRASRGRSSDPASAPTAAIPANDDTVWETDDRTISCHVIPHSADDHEVVVIIHGVTASSRAFADPVEATDESMRL